MPREPRAHNYFQRCVSQGVSSCRTTIFRPLAQQMLTSAIQDFPELQQMSPSEGFPEGPVVRDVPANPDSRYDALQGVTRLQALEAALASSRTNWMDDPASRANDWLRQPRNVPLVLDDLTQAERGGNDFPGGGSASRWSHQPSQPPTNEALKP